MAVSSDNANNNTGYSFPRNDNVFKQNQLKLSVNASIKADIEKFRYKELVDSFLSENQAEQVDILLQCVQAYDEINQEIQSIIQDEIDKINQAIAEKYPDKKEEYQLVIDTKNQSMGLTPTVHRVWAESKNICQIAKSIDGIAVKTASEQKIIHQQKTEYEETMKQAEKKGLIGSLSWKKEPSKASDIYG